MTTSERNVVLHVDDVSKNFGGLHALSDIDLEVAEGQTHAIIGPNGAGKSTLLNVIIGRLAPTSGAVVFDGQLLTGRKPHQINQLGVARVFQTPEIFPELTLLQNVMVPAFARRDGSFRLNAMQSVSHQTDIHEQAMHCLEEVGLAGQRDAIAAGKLPGPRILDAGSAISTTAGHMDPTLGFSEELHDAIAAGQTTCDGADECRRAVRRQIARGVDVIKMATTGGVNSRIGAGLGQQMFEDEARAIVETAHLYGRKVAVHAHGADGIALALRVVFAANEAEAAQGDCCQPVTNGATPTASDCLFILKTAVGSNTCDPECVCNPNGDASITATDGEAYPRFSLEAAVARAPEVIILADHSTGASTAGRAAPEKWKRLTSVPAIQAGRLYSADLSILHRYGPRVPDGIETLARFIHPEAFQ